MFIKAIEIIKNNKNSKNIKYLRRLKLLQEDLYNAIEVSKLNYYSRITFKLTHIQKNTKVWALLKRFLNNKKIPLIPPLFHGNEYVTDFKKKLNFVIRSLENNVL